VRKYRETLVDPDIVDDDNGHHLDHAGACDGCD
jgi:hypothetical protein